MYVTRSTRGSPRRGHASDQASGNGAGRMSFGDWPKAVATIHGRWFRRASSRIGKAFPAVRAGCEARRNALRVFVPSEGRRLIIAL